MEQAYVERASQVPIIRSHANSRVQQDEQGMRKRDDMIVEFHQMTNIQDFDPHPSIPTAAYHLAECRVQTSSYEEGRRSVEARNKFLSPFLSLCLSNDLLLLLLLCLQSSCQDALHFLVLDHDLGLNTLGSVE